MKTKHLLLASLMLLCTTISAIAQDVKENVDVSKAITPANKPLPYPANLRSPLLPITSSAGKNPAMMSHMNALKERESKGHPYLFTQQLPSRQRSLLPVNDKAAASANDENVFNSNSAFHLVRDINLSSASTLYIAPNAVLNNVLYFADKDAAHGTELWRTDGTAGGTYLVKDIQPGGKSSYPTNITAINGKLYFSAYTLNTDNDLWISDGTDAGTHLLKENDPSFQLSSPGNFTGVGDLVYFVTRSYETFSSTALWKTDGTPGNTSLVKDINEDGMFRLELTQLTAANGLLYFTTYNYTSFKWELWRSDGTHDGTFRVVTNTTLINNEPAQLTAYNHLLYFAADDGSGYKLWVSDGTTTGTKPAPGNNNVPINPTYGSAFPVLNGVLYIPSKSTADYIGALYKYDAAGSKGLVKVADLSAGSNANYIVPEEMAVVNNTLYFKVVNYNGGLHEELWSSQGGKENTARIQAFAPNVAIYSLVNAGGKLYFVNEDKLLGAELWSAFVSPSGTLLYPVNDIYQGSTGSYPNFFAPLNGKLLFTATDNQRRASLFITGGIPFSTLVVKSLPSVATESSDAGSYNGMAQLGNYVIFGAYDEVYGYELYRSDGTSGGTQMLNDIVPGEGYSYAQNFYTAYGHVYFLSYNPDGSFSIYRTDGSPTGLKQMTPGYQDSVYDFYNIYSDVAANGTLYYLLPLNTGISELWSSNGTTAGTHLLYTSVPFEDIQFRTVGNHLFFTASDAQHGQELWTSDGTVAGTRIVKDMNPGSGDGNIHSLFAYNDELYFGAYNGVNNSLWKSDGTRRGTVKLKNIDPTSFGYVTSNNILYFNGADNSTAERTRLWKTDGTTAGTVPVKDINHRSNLDDDIAYYFTEVNGALFFLSSDDVHGRELWKTDGTTQGTQMVKDITPGEEGSFLNYLVSYGGKLYFTKDNEEFWTSDGTAAGTMKVNDPVLSKITEMFPLVVTPDNLFISGNTNRYGFELFAGKLDNQGMLTMSKMANDKVVKAATSLDAVLSPNPTVASAQLHITGNEHQVLISLTDMSGKQLWQSKNSNPALINLPTEKLSPGIYIITITNGKESKTLKLVKQ